MSVLGKGDPSIESGPSHLTERKIGAVRNGEGVSIIVKYNGLNVDVYLTTPQCMDLVKAIGDAAGVHVVAGMVDLDPEGRPN